MPKQSLALSHPPADAVLLVYPSRECLAVPQVHPHPSVARLGPQDPVDFTDLLGAQATGPTRPLSFPQARQALLFKAAYPILERAWPIPQNPRHLRARHALRHQQHSMKAMIIA